MLLIALIQLIFTLESKRIIGIIVNVLITGAGFGLEYLKAGARWLLPLSHTVYMGHWDKVYNKVNFPFWGSYLYFVTAVSALLFMAVKTVRSCSFHIIGGSEQ